MSRKLQYFNLNGYAESIRYMLHYGGLDFEDVRYERKDWPIQSVKDSLPYGQMPLYEENGRSLNQSLAIARYVAHEVGLLPKDPWVQAQLDAAALNVYDWLKKLVPFLMEKDPEKKESNKKEVNEIHDFYLSRFEKELKAGNGYFGGQLSWADFILTGAVEILSLYLNDAVDAKYPTVKALITKIHSVPRIKEYVAKRPNYSL